MTLDQQLFCILWNRATVDATPFEVAEIVPEIQERLGLEPHATAREVRDLIGELRRLPDGRNYFCIEGDAVVPLPELFDAMQSGQTAEEAYPFET